MEDSRRSQNCRVMSVAARASPSCVSILVLMEDSRRFRCHTSFNPCSDGRFPTVYLSLPDLILVFNPCSDGRFPTVGAVRALAMTLYTSFNPCSDGRFPTVVSDVGYRHRAIQNPCSDLSLRFSRVSILVLMEDSRRFHATRNSILSAGVK